MKNNHNQGNIGTSVDKGEYSFNSKCMDLTGVKILTGEYTISMSYAAKGLKHFKISF